MKKNTIFISLQKNEVTLEENLDENHAFYIKSDEFISNIKRDISYSFSKIMIHDSGLIITNDIINELNKLKENLLIQQKIDNLNLFFDLKNSISYLINCLNYILKTFKGSFNIGNITEASIFNNILGDLKQLIHNPNFDIKNLSKNVNFITKELNHLINFVNMLKVSCYKLLKTFQNIAKCIKEFQIKKPTNVLMIIESYLIDHNQEPILCMVSNTNNKNNVQEMIKMLLLKSLDDFLKIVNENSKQDCINEYFIQEIKSFKDIVLSIIVNFCQQNHPIDQLISLFDEQLSSYKIINIQMMLNDHIYFNETKNADIFFALLLNISRYHFHFNILNVIRSIFQFYDSNICTKQIYQISKEIMKLNNETRNDEKEMYSYETILDNIQKQIEKIQKENKYFYFDSIFQIILKHLLNQNVFLTYHKLLISDESDFDDDFFSLFDLLSFSSYLAYTQFSVDINFNFLIAKNFNQNAKEKVIEREIEILKNNKSKFIVHLVNEENKEKLIFPYFPLQTINYCLFSTTNKINFSLVDRIIIIKEIAIGLNDLYLMNQYHGNLSISSIYISSDKDAYIGEIAYDRSRENDFTKTPEKVIYRSPENMKNKDENESIGDIFFNDVYSFGIIMYEVISGKSWQTQLRKNPRSIILKVLTDGIKDFLFNEVDNEYIFDPYSCDIRGDNLIGIKDIIEKCLNIDPNERFHSFLEISNAIENLAIYEKNREEIEYRIENAKDASSYQCQLVDIVKSYYQGNELVPKVIENILKNISYYLYTGSNKSFPNNGDVIKNIYDYFNIKIIDEPET